MTADVRKRLDAVEDRLSRPYVPPRPVKAIDYEAIQRELDALMLCNARPRFDMPREEIRRVVAAEVEGNRDCYTAMQPVPCELRRWVDAEVDRVAGADFATWQAAQRRWNPRCMEVARDHE